MSKFIDIILTGPPGVDFPALVGVEDEQGQQIQLGKWLPPDDGAPFWRYRLTPAELLMHMIAGAQGEGEVVQVVQLEVPKLPARADRRPDPTVVHADRAALRQKLAGARPKVQPAAPDPAAAALLTEKCPACRKPFNPARHELLDCGACGESKCTANCFASPADPCLDCQALRADPDEGGFDPASSASGSASGPPAATIKDPALRAKMAAESAAVGQAVGNRLFDGAFHGKGDVSEPESDED